MLVGYFKWLTDGDSVGRGVVGVSVVAVAFGLHFKSISDMTEVGVFKGVEILPGVDVAPTTEGVSTRDLLAESVGRRGLKLGESCNSTMRVAPDTREGAVLLLLG